MESRDHAGKQSQSLLLSFFCNNPCQELVYKDIFEQERTLVPHNVIVLAIGLSGSSILTNLVAQAGYAFAGPTVKIPDYDTFENQELVRLNKRLLDLADANSFPKEYRPEFIERIKALYGKIDDSEYRAFAKHCEAHQPWVWKDPRLTITMYFWKHYLDLSRVKFIVNDREALQGWISWNLRRQIQSFRYAKRYMDQVVVAMRHFLEEHSLPFEHVRYEDLICTPEPTLARLNKFLGCNLTLDDLSRVYQGPLRKKTHGCINFVKAGLIFLKNYDERLVEG